MTDRLDPQRDNPTRPIGSVGDIEDQVGASLGDDGQDGVPSHEMDEDETVGGGMMSQGGTSVDRGTGVLDGQAQGDGHDGDDVDDGAGVGIEDD